ncbi:hypothetical protein, partial [Salmonella sp. SAL4457]|uniref:hypothetical protein n=1 Tax=Salmonella sp. SAL4457 TaxID=3159912 RepID=UPI00397872C1
FCTTRDHGPDQSESEQSPREDEGLTQKHRAILATLLELGATGETKRRTREEVVEKINRRASVHDYGRQFGDLTQRKLTRS